MEGWKKAPDVQHTSQEIYIYYNLMYHDTKEIVHKTTMERLLDLLSLESFSHSYLICFIITSEFFRAFLPFSPSRPYAFCLCPAFFLLFALFYRPCNVFWGCVCGKRSMIRKKIFCIERFLFIRNSFLLEEIFVYIAEEESKHIQRKLNRHSEEQIAFRHQEKISEFQRFFFLENSFPPSLANEKKKREGRRKTLYACDEGKTLSRVKFCLRIIRKAKCRFPSTLLLTPSHKKRRERNLSSLFYSFPAIFLSPPLKALHGIFACFHTTLSKRRANAAVASKKKFSFSFQSWKISRALAKKS